MENLDSFLPRVVPLSLYCNTCNMYLHKDEAQYKVHTHTDTEGVVFVSVHSQASLMYIQSVNLQKLEVGEAKGQGACAPLFCSSREPFQCRFISSVVLLVSICNKTDKKGRTRKRNKLNQLHICTLQKVWFHPLSPLLSVFQKWRQERPGNKLVFVPHCM